MSYVGTICSLQDKHEFKGRLNPKVADFYGATSAKDLIELVKELGEELASICYLVSGGENTESCGAMPHFITTTSGDDIAVQRAIYNFTRNIRRFEEEYWIIVFTDSPREGDIQLWLL